LGYPRYSAFAAALIPQQYAARFVAGNKETAAVKNYCRPKFPPVPVKVIFLPFERKSSATPESPTPPTAGMRPLQEIR